MESTTYRMIESDKCGCVHDLGTATLHGLPFHARLAVEADPNAGEWTVPALDGDRLLDDLYLIIRVDITVMPSA